MSKTRVDDLAKKLGIDNKEMLARLKAAGIVVKNHLSSVTEEDVNKVMPQAPPRDAGQDEVRVKPTLIRRRAKVVEEPPSVEPVTEVVAEAPVMEPAESKEVSKEKKETGAAIKEKPAAERKTITEVEPEAKVDESVPVTEAPPVPVAPEPQKSGTAQARIIGRVEILPTPSRPKPAERRTVIPDQTRPQRRPSTTERPGTRPVAKPSVAPGVAPADTAAKPDDRKKGGRLPDSAPTADTAKTGKKVGVAGARRKESLKKADIIEKRERVFEPGLRSRPGKGRKREREQTSGKKTEITVPKAIKRIIKVSESITVGELAKRMGIKATDLIRSLMGMGMMATINHPLDVDTASLLSAEFGYEIENVTVDIDEMLVSVEDAPESLQKRPPVVTIMGHVDHGKTSLLDAIRETNVIAGEAGGITQHIGAYDVELKGRKITFLDTPGHEAFTAMRARGAKVTDIVVLVVAADDGVMPQTREAINHSKAAGVPIIVAINKIDKPEAKPERVKQELMEFALVSEEWGGDTIFVEVSAKKRLNLDGLLEMVLLQADVLELKTNPEKPARGTIVEAKLDKGRGPVATVLVQEGTLRGGDYFVAGTNYGRVRAMQNDRGEKVLSAGPAMPVEVIGFTGVPDAGDIFAVLPDEKQAKEIAQYRQQKTRESELAKSSKLSLEQLYEKIQKGEVKDLNVIVKADVQGSVEAVAESLRKLSTDAIRLNVIHTSVGGIIESDVNLASASNAIILGFNVRPEVKAQTLAEQLGVDIRLYTIIYDAVDDIKKAMEGLLEPTLREKHLGRAEIRETFSVPKVGFIAGCYVQDGKMVRNSLVRLVRDNVVIFEGKMASLRRFKEDVREVASGYECGIGIENFNDLKVGDIIESYEIEKVAATL